MERLEVVLDVGVDALAQVGEFLVNLAIAVVGLAELHVPARSFATLKSGKTPTATPAGMASPSGAPVRSLREDGTPNTSVMIRTRW